LRTHNSKTSQTEGSQSPIDFLPGQEFGDWTTIARVANSKHHKTQWLCRCKCGIERTVVASDIKNGKSTCCGRCTTDKFLPGQKIGDWTIIGLYNGNEVYGNSKQLKENSKFVGTNWLCRCECGREKAIAAHYLKRKKSTRCQECHNEFSGNRLVFSNRDKQYTAFGVTKTIRGWASDPRCVVSIELLKTRLHGQNKHYGKWSVEKVITTPKNYADSNIYKRAEELDSFADSIVQQIISLY
jgi:hypothetical protein